MSFELLVPGLRRMREHPVRCLLLVAGIAFGSFLFATTTKFNQATDESLREGTESVSGSTDLVVSGSDAGFSEDVLEQVRSVPGVRSAVPLVLTRALFKNRDGKFEALMVFGVDFFVDAEVRSYGGESNRILRDPLEFIGQADSIAVPAILAQQKGLRLNSVVQLMTSRGLKAFTVRAILQDDGLTKGNGAGVILMDIEAARISFGKAGMLDRIDLRTDESVPLRNLAELLKLKLGDAFTVDVPSEQVDVFRKSLTAFQKMSTFLSWLAFFVAFVIVLLSVSRSVLERTGEVGILRSLGATKGQVFSLLLAENFFLSLVGAIFGVIVAVLISDRLTASAQASISAQTNVQLIITSLQWGAGEIARFILTGCAVASCAAFAPVIYVTRLGPLDSLRTSRAEATVIQRLRFPLVIGCGVLSLSAVLHAAKMGQSFQTLLIFLGAFCVGPFIVIILLRLLDGLLGNSLSAVGKLALTHAARSDRGTQIVVLSLLFGTTILTVVTIVSGSFLAAIDARVFKAASPDIYVVSHGNLTANQVQPLDYSLKEKIAKIPGAEGTFGQRATRITYAGRSITVRAVEEIPPINFTTPYSYLNVIDRPVERAGHDLYHLTGLPVMVNETFVQLFGLKTGDQVVLKTLKGPTRAKIVGVVSDLFGGGGALFMSLRNYREHWGDALVTGFGVFVRPGVDVEVVRTKISQEFSELGLVASTRRDIRAQGEVTLKRGFAYLKVIEWVLLLVSFLGFVNAFLIEVLGRTRIIATVRSLGMTSGEILTATSLEGCLVGAAGITTSLGLGWLISFYFLKFTLGPQYGWVIDMHVDWGALAKFGLAMTAAVAILSLYPSRRASQQEIKNALSAN